MAPNRRDRKAHLALLALLIGFQVSVSSIVFVIANESEHTHVIFHDDLEEGNADEWEMWFAPDPLPNSICAVVLDDGNNVLSERGAVWAIAGDSAWTNYTLEVKIKFIEEEDEAHIIFRMARAPAPRYFVRFPSQALYITKEYEEKFPDLESKRFVRESDTWYRLKLVCIGNSFWLYVDDVLKITYVDEDNPLLSGRIGLESGPQAHIYFDDVKVYTPHRLFVTYLIEKAQDEINEARILNVDTGMAENRLAQAQTAFSEGELSLAESLTRETISLARTAQEEKVSDESSTPPPTQKGTTFSIELITGLISIGAAGTAVAGWAIRTSRTSKRRKILFKRLVDEIDEIYSNFKMNARRCEAELQRLSGEVLDEFKDGMINENNYSALENRIDDYMREIKEQIEKERTGGSSESERPS
jgi:hypothetical protein